MQRSLWIKALVPVIALILTASLYVPPVYAAEAQQEETGEQVQQEQTGDDTGEETGGADVGVDPEYEGNLDAATMAPVEDSDSSGAADVRVKLSDNLFFDRGTGDYVYVLSGGQGEISTNMADGMFTRNPVYMRFPETMTIELSLDGEMLKSADFENITTIGDYTVRAGTGKELENVFTFSIVGAASGRYAMFTAPPGFEIVRKDFDGVMDTSGGTTVDMAEEGHYDILCESKKIDQSYELDLKVDRTAPTLEFDGADKKGRARGAVRIKGYDKEDTITVYRDNEEITLGDDMTLKDIGSYRITAEDEAGNSRSYNLVIMLYFNLSSWILVGSIAALFVVMVVVLLIKRKRFRVR